LSGFVFLFAIVYLSQIAFYTKSDLEIKKLEKDLQTTQAENEYLSRKITDANTINNLSLASKELGLVKTDKLDYIMTTEEVFVAK